MSENPLAATETVDKMLLFLNGDGNWSSTKVEYKGRLKFKRFCVIITYYAENNDECKKNCALYKTDEGKKLKRLRIYYCIV